jgi:FixJ family two-component response regulator
MVIAIVDDDSGVLKALGRLLSDCGYSIEPYASAEAFLAVASASRAKCIVVDIGLSGMSGLEMVSKLSTDGFRFPVIFISAFIDDNYRKQALELGCIAYLHKPFAPELLIAAVEKAIGKSADHPTPPQS